MAIASPSTYLELLKETFSSDDLEAMFWTQTKVLDKVENVGDAFTIGEKVIVPALVDFSGGYSVKDKAGGTLNAADHIKPDTLEYEIVYHYFQVGVEFGLLNQANGSSTSVGVALDQELSNALKAMYRQVERQFLSSGDSLIAKCGTTSGSTEVELDSSDYGYDAIVRKWLYKGLPVDIGTTADEDSVVAGAVIQSVERDSSTPSITIDSSVTTDSNDYVSIKDARSGTTSYEQPGLRQIGGTNDTVGGINPSTAGNDWWQPAKSDTSTTSLSLELLTDMQDAVFQETGEEPTDHITSRRQESQYYLLLQSQTRFAQDGSQGAGKTSGPTWNGIRPVAVPAVPTREWHMTSLNRDFIRVYGKHKTPTWFSELEGTKKGLRYNTGNTDFGDTLAYPCNIVPRRRNGTASATALTD